MEIFNAIKKPFTDLKNLLIGIVLNLIPIVNFLSLGYALECSGVGANKPSTKLLAWKDWGDLFIKGFLAFVITLIYGIPIMILSAVFFGGKLLEVLKTEAMQGFGGMQGTAGTQLLNLGMTGAMLTGLLIITLVALFISYILPAAILGYLKNRSFGQAFNFSVIFKKAFNKQYFIAWLVVLVIGVIIAWINGLVFNYQIVFWIVASGLGFINYVIMYTLFGEAYRKVKV